MREIAMAAVVAATSTTTRALSSPSRVPSSRQHFGKKPCFRSPITFTSSALSITTGVESGARSGSRMVLRAGSNEDVITTEVCAEMERCELVSLLVVVHGEPGCLWDVNVVF